MFCAIGTQPAPTVMYSVCSQTRVLSAPSRRVAPCEPKESGERQTASGCERVSEGTGRVGAAVVGGPKPSETAAGAEGVGVGVAPGATAPAEG